MSGVSDGRADDRRNLAGSLYRFLKQIEERPKTEIKIYTPNGSATYFLDKTYQAAPNANAITEFKRLCGEFVSNWH
jgi:hypothetical protein